MPTKMKYGQFKIRTIKLIPMLLLFLVSLLFNCKEKATPKDHWRDQKEASVLPNAIKVADSTQEKQLVYALDHLDPADFLLDRKPVMLNSEKFAQLYPKIDSTRTTLWECGSPFEWLDDTWMEKTYGKKDSDLGTFKHFDGKITEIYAQNLRFAMNNHLVLLNEAGAKNHQFKIKNYDIVLDERTTVEEFSKMFPNLNLEATEDKKRVRFRISVESESTDAFLFYFENDRLHAVVLWWLLC